MEQHSSLLAEAELWIAVAFVIFVGLFLKFVWPQITALLDKRSVHIAEQLEKANRLRAEAEALLADYKKQREEQAREAEAIIATAQKDADALRARAETELKASIDRRSQQALDKITRAETEATAAIRRQMLDVATGAVRDVVRAELEGAKEDPAIAGAISAIEKQLH